MSDHQKQPDQTNEDLTNQADEQEQIAQLTEAIRMNPNDPESHCNLGLFLQDRGEIESAIACFREAIRVNPNYAEAHYNLGFLLSKDEGQLEEAIAEYREAICLNPDKSLYHSILGTVLDYQFETGDMFKRKTNRDGAIAEYQEAIRLNPEDAITYMALGRILGAEERDKAIAALQKAKELFRQQGNSEVITVVDYYLEEIYCSPDDY
jgi:tetratricopeptide (TPR) repeat protein